MNFLDILKELGVFTVLAGVIAWLIRTLGKYLIDQNIKVQEYQLSQSLEKFKSELEFLNVKQSRLHEKRVGAIQKLYEYLTEFHIDLDTLIRWKNVTGMSDEQIKQQRIDEANKTFESGSKFSKYYLMNKLYFSEDVCQLIDEIIKTMRGCQYDLTIEYQWMNISPDLKIKSFEQARDKLDNDVPELKNKIELQFREILGVK